MKLHIFNPEHDMALAVDEAHLTLPHAIQKFKVNLGFLPALWAADGDFVLVDDVLYSIKALSQVRKPHAEVLFITPDDLRHLVFTDIEPWGWDKCVRRTLTDAGVAMDILPSDDMLSYIRRLSSRKYSSVLFQHLRNGVEDITCGESFFCESVDEVYEILTKYEKIVVKAPWSSSGRGVRYIDTRVSEPLAGWMKKVIKHQGGISVEPYYKKVRDFALEFYSHGDGRIDYCGISLFETIRGNYTGNIVASEIEKMHILSNYLPLTFIEIIIERIKNYLSSGDFMSYVGPLGIDMMIVANNGNQGFLLNPCVEINVRRTMGHVANSFKPDITAPSQLMHIVHDVNYKLRFDAMENNYVKVI